MTEQPPLVRVNIVGIVLEVAYSAIFFRIARTNKNAKILVGALAFTFSVLALTYIVEPPGTFQNKGTKLDPTNTFLKRVKEFAIQLLGLVCCSVNIICFASPLAAAKEVIR